MLEPPKHVARVLGTPLPGVYATRLSSGQHFGKHWHDSYGFGVLERGAHSSASGRGQVRAYAGNVITTNPGEVHDGRPLGVATRQWSIVSIEPDAMAALVGARTASLNIVRPVIEDVELSGVLHGLFEAIEQWDGARDSSDGALQCEESLVRACAMLMSRHGSAAPPPVAGNADVRRMRERLADNVLPAPSLSELAALTGLSRFQALRRFESIFGMPPHAWLRRLRAERARALIREGESLATAAARSGFSDQSHMTRSFLRQYGFTPGAWRRAIRRPQ